MNSDIFNELDKRYRQFKINLKGSAGEFAATFALERGTAEKLKIVQNVFVPISNGKTAEIDLVIIHPTGIYVVECKNYNGWIFGSANNKNWTQTFSNGKHFQFYNPVLQNQYHIKSLSKYLEVPENYFKSYIVFGEKCELKKVPENTDKVAVMKLHSLSDNINHDIVHRELLFSEAVVDMFTDKIKMLTDKTGQKKREHIEQVKKDHPDAAPKETNTVPKSFFSSFFKF